MMRAARAAALFFTLLAAAGGRAALRAQAPGAAPGGPRVHLVAMVERGQYGIAFEPQRTHALTGDTVRFVQRGILPHNVRFRSVPAGVDLGAALESPMLTEAGATYDLVLDGRFAPGKYLFVCVPHEVMGMAGLLYVDAPGGDGRRP